MMLASDAPARQLGLFDTPSNPAYDAYRAAFSRVHKAAAGAQAFAVLLEQGRATWVNGGASGKGKRVRVGSPRHTARLVSDTARLLALAEQLEAALEAVTR